MIRSARWLFVAALLPVAACSSNSSAPATAAAATPALAAADQGFINAVAGVNAGVIQESQVATSKARAARVKQYASKIIADHTSVDQQLTTLAQSKGVTPDATVPQVATDAVAKLTADKASGFDRDYLHEQLAAQQAAVKATQDEVANGQDADVKQFASTILPTLQQHVSTARRLGAR